MLFASVKTEDDLEKLKKRLVKNAEYSERLLGIRSRLKYSRRGDDTGRTLNPGMLTNAELLAFYRELVEEGKETKNPEAELLLRKIKTKSNSGVAVISLLTKPFPCPGRCTYCPTERNMPKSYLAKEPAAARALANDFDPRKQIFSRLESLLVNGHPVEKIEMIVIGGTWSFYHPAYQDWFIAECYRAVNDFDPELFAKEGSYFSKPDSFSSPTVKKTFAELQDENESAKCRMIGLSIETRPDYVTPYEIERLRKFGVTKVEIGAQHLDDQVLRVIKRDMKEVQIGKASERLRNAGFKVVYHMMPNLPGSTPEKDIEMFRQLFSEGSAHQPDQLKIYPCMVLEKSELYETWKKGEFRAYSDEELMHILREAKKIVPPYVRIIRVIRDIPATYIQAGSKVSNLRQWLLEDMKKNGWQCKCIRCREIRDMEIDPDDFILTKQEFGTPSGREIFLSFECNNHNILNKETLSQATSENSSKSDPRLVRGSVPASFPQLNLQGRTHSEIATKKLAAFLRLRLPNKDAEKILPELEGTSFVRELHTYGRLTPISDKGTQTQHRGFGRRLMEEAERIGKEAGYKKMAVISGIGVREYYRKLGYELEGTYMVKFL